MALFAFIIRVIVTGILTIIAAIAPAQMSDAMAPNAPLDADNCKLNFAVMSDTHIRTDELGFLNNLVLNLTMNDFEYSEGRYDGIVFVGDNTDHGYEEQWQGLCSVMETYDPAENIYFAVGNHDTWTRDESGDTNFKDLFVEYTSKLSETTIPNIYYSTNINGYPFIFISSEGDEVGMYMSEEQISWFSAEMEKAAALDKPIFVFSHWPINKTHGLPVSWGDEEYDDNSGGIGEQSAQVNEILQKYENVFYFSGHIHNGLSNADSKEKLGYESVEKVGNIHSINLPAIHGINENGAIAPGCSYAVEVYENEILFRARNFMTGYWMPEYNYTITLS